MYWIVEKDRSSGRILYINNVQIRMSIPLSPCLSNSLNRSSVPIVYHFGSRLVSEIGKSIELKDDITYT